MYMVLILLEGKLHLIHEKNWSQKFKLCWWWEKVDKRIGYISMGTRVQIPSTHLIKICIVLHISVALVPLRGWEKRTAWFYCLPSKLRLNESFNLKVEMDRTWQLTSSSCLFVCIGLCILSHVCNIHTHTHTNTTHSDTQMCTNTYSHTHTTCNIPPKKF